MVASVAFHPSAVLQGSLGQNSRGDRILTVHIPEEVDDMRGPGQQRQVPLDDDAVETVIYKNQEAFKKLREGFHRSPPLMFGWTPKSSVRATGGIKYLPGGPGSSLLRISRAQPLVMFRNSALYPYK